MKIFLPQREVDGNKQNDKTNKSVFKILAARFDIEYKL